MRKATRGGRFTSPDPLTSSATIRDPQSFNRYSYALNSPYKFTDPLGLLSQYTTGANGRNWDSYGLGGAEGVFSGALSGFHQNNEPYEGDVVEDSTQKQPHPTANPPAGSTVRVDSIAVFSGTFPNINNAPPAGEPAVNPNGTAASMPFGFQLSVNYTLMNRGKPVAGVRIEESVTAEAIVISRERGTGRLVTDRAVGQYGGLVSATLTDRRGRFTDAPIGAHGSSGTPISSVSMTETLYAVGRNGSRREIATNNIKATMDYRIVNNRIVGSGKITITFSNRNTTRSVTLPPPTKFQN